LHLAGLHGALGLLGVDALSLGGLGGAKLGGASTTTEGGRSHLAAAKLLLAEALLAGAEGA
jgi:hypothetical protein